MSAYKIVMAAALVGLAYLIYSMGAKSPTQKLLTSPTLNPSQEALLNQLTGGMYGEPGP